MVACRQTSTRKFLTWKNPSNENIYSASLHHETASIQNSVRNVSQLLQNRPTLLQLVYPFLCVTHSGCWSFESDVFWKGTLPTSGILKSRQIKTETFRPHFMYFQLLVSFVQEFSRFPIFQELRNRPLPKLVHFFCPSQRFLVQITEDFLH
jgi:hypothetical protein